MRTQEHREDVVYDEPTAAIEPDLPPEEPELPPPKRPGGFAVLLTQSAVCAILLGAALAVRMLGGAGEGWRAQIRESLLDNRIVEWVFGAWSDEGEEVSAPSEEPNPAARETSLPGPDDGTSNAPVELPFPTDPAGASAVYQLTAAEPVEQTAAIRRDLPLPPCLPLLAGVLTSGYGDREHPVSGEDSFHTGWDIAAAEGTPLAAMYDATVTETGSGGSYGNYVQMRVNDRLSFLYAHCSEVLVREGDRVSAGQTVARVGSTGVSTGNHVHLEVLVDGETCDPAAVLNASVYLS